jgi:hypothetical protein
VRSLDDLDRLSNPREVTTVKGCVLTVSDAAEIFASRGITTD